MIRPVDGLYTNDKFCWVRTGRLDLAPSHLQYQRRPPAVTAPPPFPAPSIDPAIRYPYGGICDETHLDPPPALCAPSAAPPPRGSGVSTSTALDPTADRLAAHREPVRP